MDARIAQAQAAIDREVVDDLLDILRSIHDVEGKTTLLAALPQVEESLIYLPSEWVKSLDEHGTLALHSFLALTTGEEIQKLSTEPTDRDKFLHFVHQLKEIDEFYQPIGGILGYQSEMLSLITTIQEKEEKSLWQHPQGEDITEPTIDLISHGLEAIPYIAEIYPVGGAGDRLDLRDPRTQKPLPAAMLPFLGRTLLEGLIRDVQAKEYLYYKITGKQVTIPICMMTSLEKDNHTHIVNTLKENQWFGRSPTSFFLFRQPQAPLVTTEGNWVVSSNWEMQTKPGGHGVIWQCAKDALLFEWLKTKGITSALLRQINNPLSSLDHATLTFVGFGHHHQKAFGFLSCRRRVNASEGTDVFWEKKVDDEYHFGITNIEYTDFEKKGIVDKPMEGSPYSEFPSNTNILYANLDEIEEALKENPFPGMVYNPKTEVDGGLAGRLESAMQNIADALYDTQEKPFSSGDPLKTFILYNAREKTISVTKKSYKEGASIEETPVGCFYDLLANYHQLLVRCGMEVPNLSPKEKYDRANPPFLFYFHPALGPLWEVIAQKIVGGSLSSGSELQLEIAEVCIKNLQLDGSLIIKAKNPLGSIDQRGGTRYDHEMGICQLIDVRVENQGVDFDQPNIFWENTIHRHEECEILIEGSGEFIAKGVTFKGAQKFSVADGERVIVTHSKVIREKIDTKNPLWEYRNKGSGIELTCTV